MHRHTRFTLWKEIVWRPSVGLVGFFLTLLPLLSWARDEFMSSQHQEDWKIPKLLPHWHWWIWVIIGLSSLLLAVLEASYRTVRKYEVLAEAEIAERDGKLAQFEKIAGPFLWIGYDHSIGLCVQNNGGGIAHTVIMRIPHDGSWFTSYPDRSFERNGYRGFQELRIWQTYGAGCHRTRKKRHVDFGHMHRWRRHRVSLFF
jgi:hypothetical protein